MYFIHLNALGSEQQWTNAAGGSDGEVLFYPWGAQWGSTTNGYQLFASLLWYDPETDGYQTPNRYYIPRLARWLTPDPMGGDVANPQSLNRYAYVVDNPTSLTDPLGLVDHSGCGVNGLVNMLYGFGWDEFDLGQIPVYSGTTFVEGWKVGTNQIGWGLDVYNWPQGSASGAGTGPGGGTRANNCAQTPPGTPSKYCAGLQQGLAAAMKALQRKSCSAFYGGQGVQTLDATTYRFLDMNNPTTGAATIDPNNVFINSNGPYMNYTPIARPERPIRTILDAESVPWVHSLT